MQQRYYDPVIGRFYSNDPVGFKTNNPITFNRYAYGNNNPYKYIDPDGRATVGGYRVGVMDFSSWKDELKKSPVGKAWEGGELAARELPQEAVNSTVGTASKVLKNGQGLKVEGCGGKNGHGGCISMTITNKAVVLSKGLGKVYGNSVTASFIPFGADKEDGSVTANTGLAIPTLTFGGEFGLEKGGDAQPDVSIGTGLGWSFQHLIMHHNVIEAEVDE